MGNICTSNKNDYREDRTIRNTECDPKTLLNPTRSNQVDKWNVEDVFEWLSTVDDGALYELATTFRTARIRGRILDQLTEAQLIEMDIALGDRMHFKKVRNELFTKYNYMTNTILYDQHSNPMSHISNQSRGSSHSNNKEGEADDISNNAHSSIKSLPQQNAAIAAPLQMHPHLPMHYPPTTHLFKQHSSPIMHALQPTMPGMPTISYFNKIPSTSTTSAVIQNDSLHSIEENQYAAVDGRLIEGIEDYTTKDMKKSYTPVYKPPLNRSCSADEYKKPNQPCISAHQFNKSVSNPTIMNRTRSPPTPTLLDIIQSAQILKDIITVSVKTGHEIAEIMKDNNKCQQLLHLKLLIRVSSDRVTSDKCIAFCVTDKYEFNHSVYDSMAAMLVNKATVSSSNKPNIPNIHINSDQNYMGGTQVYVYSPKSNKWRQGLVLNYDEATKMGRICCYNSMGKQSIKELSLPNTWVRHNTPYVDTHHIPITVDPHHIPMTVDSWNRNVRDRHDTLLKARSQPYKRPMY